MTDKLLDDVDEMLSSSVEDDNNFNESELQDIMSEIEDLEKEFDIVEETPMTLQEKIDAELAMELEEIASAEIITEDVMDAMDSIDSEEIAVAPKSQVLVFEKNETSHSAPISNTLSEVSLAAHGKMSLNLDFKIGSETARLTIDPVKGLVVTMSGVELCINEDSGCRVTMENGMNFTIPLSSQTISTKKKSA